MTSLRIDDFEEFHGAVHQGSDGSPRAPFAWQSELVCQIVRDRRWPRTLDLPTGAGKTTCIDIALFVLALDAGSDPRERWAPRRIAMVVDRRIVVDQAAERGRRLLAALMAAKEGSVLARVRSALMSLTDPREAPLAVFTLRGGMPKDDGWARTPDQPLILASTIDQIGSRLLVQGYGVSGGMRPVHAGLLGSDTLVLLDEVHLSQPFKETLEAIEGLRQKFASNGLPSRFQFSFLSATPGEDGGSRFRLPPGDLTPKAPIARRLGASKPTELRSAKDRDQVVEKLTTAARELVAAGHATVLCVANRVATAQAAARALRAGTDAPDVVLLTGRMRPLDRDDVLRAVRPRGESGRQRAADARPLVVVGTQCVEAGADFDFDAIATESASLDALRQRFGRVDRLGEYGKAEGILVHDEGSTKGDPIYGEAMGATMKWLKQHATKKAGIDMGSNALDALPPAAAECRAPRPSAPVLLPAYFDLWMQTYPEPTAVPEPALFLHGPSSAPPDVQIVWRADVEADWLLDPGNAEALGDIVGAIAPSSLEAMSVPFLVAKRWLEGRPQAAGAMGDVSGWGEEPDASDGSAAPKPRRALRWRGAECTVVEAANLRPGDTLVLPVSAGGIDPETRTFDADATAPVVDQAERASLLARGRPAIRSHPAVLALLGLSALETDGERAALSAKCVEVAAETKDAWLQIVLTALGKSNKVRLSPVPSLDDDADGWYVLSGPRLDAREVSERLRGPETVEVGAEYTTDEDDSSDIGVEVELGHHSRDVEGFARGYAARLGLPAPVASDVALAAWLHDIGKADRRFQILLRGGSEVAYFRDVEGRVLAKSASPKAGRAERRAARRRSGYPAGARHEVQSVAMIDSIRERVADKAHDLDLVLHLVASHHGYCRPFAPPISDADPVDVALPSHQSVTFGEVSFDAVSSANGLHRLDSPLADRFWRLVRRYGWLELCWLEAILRLADHRASEMEAGGR